MKLPAAKQRGAGKEKLSQVFPLLINSFISMSLFNIVLTYKKMFYFGVSFGMGIFGHPLGHRVIT